jgi:thiol-disulfide isomerase/thioredoxin
MLTLASRPAGGSTGASLPCLTGPRTIDVDHLGGRLTVVNLWASWCSVCRKEMPVLEAAYRESGESVQFVGVDTLDETGAAAAFLRQTGASYPQLYDQQGGLLKYTRMPGLPVTLLLDATAKEIGRHVGELSEGDLRDLISTG